MLHITGSIEAVVTLDADNDGHALLCAPCVGMVSELPAVGEVVTPGALLAYINVLGSVRQLRAPVNARSVRAAGRVVDVLQGDRVNRCEFGQPLLRIALGAGADDEAGTAATAANASAVVDAALEGAPAGSVAIRASTVGTFYRRPSPDQPLYVEVGDVIAVGHAIGLIEVMKVFNRVTWAGPGEAEVVAIPAADNAEVQPGEALALVKPR